MAAPDLGFAISLPPEEAIKYFEGKGYAIGFKWQDVWSEAHAKAFTVAGVTKLDVLQDIRAELDKAIRNGGTFQEFQNNLIPTLKQKGWWGKGKIVDEGTGEIAGKRLNPRRLETIFRTNVQSAYMAGRYREQLASAATRPFWEYIAVLDNRTRPLHRDLSGRIFRYDDAFWESFYPPNGWNCRCRVRTRSERDMDRRDLASSNSDGYMDTTEQLIDRKGNTRSVPVYNDPITGKPFTADPGFGFNPGRAAFQPELDRYDKETARQYVRGSLTGPDFAQSYRRIEDQVAQRIASGQSLAEIRPAVAVGSRWPVAVLGDDDMARLGAQNQTVWLSDETLVKQLVNRQGQGVDVADYWRVQDVLERPALVIAERDYHLKFIRQDEKWWVAVVKATKDGKENYLQSFYPTNIEEVNRQKRIGKVIYAQ